MDWRINDQLKSTDLFSEPISAIICWSRASLIISKIIGCHNYYIISDEKNRIISNNVEIILSNITLLISRIKFKETHLNSLIEKLFKISDFSFSGFWSDG